MSLRRNISLVGLVLGVVFVSGCSVESEGTSEPKVTLSGNVGAGAVSTRGFGGVTIGKGGVHVAARRLHHRGESGGNVEVLAGADGNFRLDVARGARYVITVDDAEGHSALVTFGNGSSALSVEAGGGSAEVSMGDVRVIGGEAKSDIVIDGRFGLAATLAEANEVFEAANGAILEAQAAVEEARKAADEALKEADIATQEALAAAEEAKKISP